MNEAREDGPAVAKLFADLDARVGHREVLPDAMDLRGALKDVARIHDQAAEEIEHLGHCATFNEGGGECDCRVTFDLVTPTDPAEEAMIEGQEFIQAVGKALHQAGEAAIHILAEMCAAEFALGNPRNMPEPMLGWYALTLGYQLCVFEFTARDEGERLEHAQQLKRCIGALSDRTDYARGVQDEIKDLLNARKPVVAKLLGADFDPTYGGVLPSVAA